VCLGRYAVNPREVSSHLVGRPEAARGGDAIDRVVGVLEQVLGAADSFGAHPLQRCGAGRLAEASGVGVAGAVVGILLLFAGNGGVSVAETTLPSGIAAVLVATVPLWMIVFAWPLQHQRITVRAAAGLAVGLGGVAILVGGGTASGRLTGVLIVLGASAAWGFGSVLSHRLALPDNALLVAAIEMLAGGAVLLAVAAGSGEFSRVQWSSLPASSWIALAYLIGPGSILAFTAYGYALSHLPVTTVSTYAYVNPVVAVLAGIAFLGELFTWREGLGAALVLVSVIITLRRSHGSHGASRPAPGAIRDRGESPEEETLPEGADTLSRFG
jgi:drug/metabolite transporter (DMT)-like permease